MHDQPEEAQSTEPEFTPGVFRKPNLLAIADFIGSNDLRNMVEEKPLDEDWDEELFVLSHHLWDKAYTTPLNDSRTMGMISDYTKYLKTLFDPFWDMGSLDGLIAFIERNTRKKCGE